LLFSLPTEVLQLIFVNGRNAQLGDLIIDGAGAPTGLLSYYIVRYIRLFSSDLRKQKAWP